MKWLDKYKQGGYVPCYECGGEIPMAQFGIHSGKHEKCEKFPDEKVKRTREGKERPSDVVSPYEEISNIKYFDKDQQKAMNTQYTELLGRMPGLSKDDFTAMYRDSVRTNANIIRPDYEKYFNKGALRPEYQNIKGNFTPAHLYYKERFPQGMTVEGALQYHNQPGMPAFSNIVNSGYKPLPQKQYGGELPMAQNGKTTKGTLIQEYQRKGNVEQRGGLRPILQEGIPRGDMQSYFPLPQSRQPNSDYGRRFTGESFPEYIVKDDPQSRINLRNYYNIGDPAKANTLDSAKYASTIPILRGMNFPRIRVNDESTLTKTYPVHFTPEQKDSISREQLLSGNTSYRNPGSRSRYFPSDNLMTVESRDFDPWAPLEAEMAHALQYSTRSDRQWIDWDEKSIELTKKHSSKDTYETPGTIEYDAHNENTGKAPQIETGINNNAAMRLRLKKQGLPWYKQGGDLPCYDCGGDILSAQKGKVLDKYQTKGTVTQEAKYLPIIRGQQYSEIGSIYESPYERNQQAIAEQEKREQEKPTGKQTTVGMPRQTVTLAEKIRRNKEYIDGKAHLSLSPQGNIVNSRPDLTLEGKYVSEKQEALVSGRVDNFINSANIASLGEFSGVVKPALNSAKRVIEKFNQTSVGQYINDVKQASKYANKLKLPTYRNVYRAEPLKYRQDGSDELAGRWFESDPNKTNFYVENLKSTDPNSGVRVLRTKLTDVDFNNQWGKNMSEEARRRSIGIGEYPDYRTARDAHSGDKTFQSIINMESNTLRPEDWADLYGNSSLYNKSEGILAGDLVNNLRYSVPSNPSTVSRSTNFGALDKATATKYLINATQKYESPILGIPRKYFPLKNGGIIKDDLGYWNPANHGKIVEINSPNITMKGVSQPLMGISNTGDVQYMTPGNDYNFDGERVTEIPMAEAGTTLPPKVKKYLPITPQQQYTSIDSLYHQRDKTRLYDEYRGGASGNPLPHYADASYYNKFYKDNVEPQLKYYQSAMEKGEAGDFIFNTGKDPRVFAYQEYLRRTDPGNKTGWADVDGKWKDRKKLPSDFDKLYQSTIGKLSENERRKAINNGRDWYYQNTYTDPQDVQGNYLGVAGRDYWSKTLNKATNTYTYNKGPDGTMSPAYAKTWYGRIWNTNDFSKFNANNPLFTKQQGGQIPMAQNGNKEGGEKNKFNTKLKGNASESFNYHSELFPSLLNDSFDYDTKGFYKQIYDEYNGDLDAITKALTPNSPTQHIGTDRYKKPNHPTFSNESKYSIPIIRPGGKWGHNEEEDYDYFKATRRNIKNMNNSDGSPFNYFKRAEDYNQDGIPDVKLFFRNEPVFKQGGWLNKYAEQEGNLPMAQTGKTIYTSDKKRVQAYKDSLTLYNSGERANRIASKRATDNKLPYEAMLEIQKDDEYNNALGRLKNVEPISSSPKYDVYTEGAGFDNTSFQFPRWAKPKEPVEYKKPKLDTSNWKQSSLDSLNLYNGGNEMAKWGKNNPNFTTTEHNKKADELDIKYPVSSMPWNKKNSFIGATNWATLNSTKSGYWGVPLYDKPVGVQKESVQPIKTIVKEVEKPIPSEPKVQDITPAPKKSVIPEQQRGQIVYGPTNSAIGYMTKNGFEPIKRRDHLAKANQAEIDLLNNPEALKQYVKEKLDRMRKGQ